MVCEVARACSSNSLGCGKREYKVWLAVIPCSLIRVMQGRVVQNVLTGKLVARTPSTRMHRFFPLVLTPMLAWGATALAASPESRSVVSPCQIDGKGHDSAAFHRIATVLTDTGAVGSHFAPLRAELGITGVRFSDLVVVADTTLCRRAIDSWKAHYRTYGVEFADMATDVQGGLLVRMTPNRYSLAVALFHPYTIATFFVTDPNFVVVRPYM